VYVIVVRRYREASDAQGKHVRAEIVPLQDADGEKGHEGIHEYSLVPTEVTGNETHSEAEVEASDRRN